MICVHESLLITKRYEVKFQPLELNDKLLNKLKLSYNRNDFIQLFHTNRIKLGGGGGC